MKDVILLSLMSQYTPFYKAKGYKELSHRLSTYEYEKVLDTAQALGFKGYMQERTSAKEEYTPDFDLCGI
jgi:putative pyruvate formate lyase activating enzyme